MSSSVNPRAILKAGAGIEQLVPKPAVDLAALRKRLKLRPGDTPHSDRLVVRAADLFVARFEFLNLRLANPWGSTPPALVRRRANIPAYVIVHLPPQVVTEEVTHPVRGALHLSSNSASSAVLPVRSVVGGPVRLGFRVPDEVDSMPLTLSALLDWTGWSPTAPGDPIRASARPNLEIPFRMIATLPERPDWWATGLPSGPLSRAALWRAGPNFASASSTRDLVFARSRDVGIKSAAGIPDGSLSLTADQRKQLVSKTAQSPAEVSQLLVSALGGWLRATGTWENPEPVAGSGGLERWSTAMTMGREHYVEVVERGYLLPFGHKASLVTVSERRFGSFASPLSRANVESPLSAILTKRQFIVVTKPRRDFSATDVVHAGPDGVQPHGAHMPFVSATLRTLRTRPLDPNDGACRWVRVENRDVDFLVTVVDHRGRELNFALPMMFVKVPGTGSTIDPIAARAAYTAKETEPRRSAALEGAAVAFVPQDNPGDTDFPTQSVVFDVMLKHESPGETSELPLLPVMERATIDIPALERLGVQQTSRQVTYGARYRAKGQELFVESESAAFLRLAAPVALGFSGRSDQAGGVVTPNMSLDGISRANGVVGGAAATDVATGNPPPIDMTSVLAGAKILGSIDLGTLLADVSTAPTIRTFEPSDQQLARTAFTWNPSLKEVGVFRKYGSTTPSLVINMSVTAEPGKPPAVNITGVIEHFQIGFGGPVLVGLPFQNLRFLALAGQKPQVAAMLADDAGIQFGGPLEFLNPLRRLIPLNGFDNPPAVTVDTTGIRAGFQLPLPDVAIGVFALANISFGAALAVPFTDQPARLRFNFSERGAPCTVTVSGFSGTAFLALALGLDGLEQLEAQIEFGGSVAFDVGVASGGVAVLAGVYWSWKMGPPEEIALAGHLRATGALEFLGIVAINTEIRISLSYVFAAKLIEGMATISVEVELAFFSKSVSFEVRRQFPGPSADPTFKESVSAADWDEYWAAFAGEE